MGHSKATKAHTHSRLVEAAAARFKERGIDGISVADLMKDLGLTHGGFYKHFGSRDALVAEALGRALTHSGEVMRKHLFDGESPDIPGFVDFYLHERHRDGLVEGCAVAALAGDAPRKSAAVHAQFRRQIETNLESLTEALGPGASQERRETAIQMLSNLYGALMIARATGVSPLSLEILAAARKGVVALSGAAKRPRKRVAAAAPTRKKTATSRR